MLVLISSDVTIRGLNQRESLAVRDPLATVEDPLANIDKKLRKNNPDMDVHTKTQNYLNTHRKTSEKHTKATTYRKP